jgi:hypothetical protein
MNMKNTSTRFLAAILFSAIAISSLRAQTNAADGTAATATSTNSNTVVAARDVSTVRETISPAGSEERNQRRNNSASGNFWNIWSNVAIIVPLAGMFIGFAIPVTIIIIIAYASHRRHKMANETLRAMIEKGLPITPELVASLKSKSSDDAGEDADAGSGAGASAGNQSRKDLRNGLILTGIGAGVVMLCGSPGWIIVFLGVAFLLIGMLNLGKGNKC